MIEFIIRILHNNVLWHIILKKESVSFDPLAEIRQNFYNKGNNGKDAHTCRILTTPRQGVSIYR